MDSVRRIFRRAVEACMGFCLGERDDVEGVEFGNWEVLLTNVEIEKRLWKPERGNDVPRPPPFTEHGEMDGVLVGPRKLRIARRIDRNYCANQQQKMKVLQDLIIYLGPECSLVAVDVPAPRHRRIWIFSPSGEYGLDKGHSLFIDCMSRTFNHSKLEFFRNWRDNGGKVMTYEQAMQAHSPPAPLNAVPDECNDANDIKGEETIRQEGNQEKGQGLKPSEAQLATEPTLTNAGASDMKPSESDGKAQEIMVPQPSKIKGVQTQPPWTTNKSIETEKEDTSDQKAEMVVLKVSKSSQMEKARKKDQLVQFQKGCQSENRKPVTIKKYRQETVNAYQRDHQASGQATPTGRGGADGSSQGWLGAPVATSTPKDAPPTRQGDQQNSQSGTSVGGASQSEGSAQHHHHTINESLYMQVFKLFQVTLESVPNNVHVVKKIFHFLRVHDSALSKLLCPGRICSKENARHAPKMLTSLMSKLAGNPQRIRSMIPIFFPNALLKPGLLNILRVQAERNMTRGDEVATTLVKNVLLFLYYCSKVDAEGSKLIAAGSSGGEGAGGKKIRRQPQISYPVLTNRFEIDTVLMEQEENVSLGVILQCVQNEAQNVVSSQVKEKKQNPMISMQPGGMDRMLEDSQTILEVGLTLVFSHVQLFMDELKEEQELKRGNRLALYQEMVGHHVEMSLAKVVSEACKKMKDSQKIERQLLKLREIGSTDGITGTTSSGPDGSGSQGGGPDAN